MRPSRALIPLAVAGIVLLGACSTSTTIVPSARSGAAEAAADATPTAVPPVPVSPSSEPRAVEFRSVLQSSEKDTASVGPESQVTYGWNNLVGPTVFDDAPAQARLQGSIWYVDGSGPFSGFLTLTFPDASTLAMSMEGRATKEGDLTRFDAELVVIGGSGRYANASGSGGWSGSRAGALGSAVVFDGEIELAQ